MFQNTSPQEGDNLLLCLWREQLDHIHWAHNFGLISVIPGNVCTGLVGEIETQDSDNLLPPLHFPPENPHHDEDEDEQEGYFSDLENILSHTMLEKFTQNGQNWD